MISSSLRHEFVSYHDPAVEGTSAYFICPLGQLLTGPNISTCVGNGEWEPDPRELECKGILQYDCNPNSFFNYKLLKPNKMLIKQQVFAV